MSFNVSKKKKTTSPEEKLRRKISWVKWIKPTPFVIFLLGVFIAIWRSDTFAGPIFGSENLKQNIITFIIAVAVMVVLLIILNLRQKFLEDKLEKFTAKPEKIPPKKIPYTS